MLRHGHCAASRTVRWGTGTYNPRPGRLIENVRVEDVDVTTGAVTAGDEEPSLVGGYDAEHPVSGVHVVNMRRDGRACHTLEEANIRVLPNASDITIE